jgi:PKD repeat protein
MKKKLSIMLFALIAFALTNCSDSTSPDVELNLPTNFTISQVQISQFQLTWQDNSKKEDGYKIERRLDEGEWIELAELDENAESYLDDISVSRQTWNTVFYSVYSYEDEDVSTEVVLQSVIDFPAPTQFTAEYTDAVYLEWTDNSNGEDGFSIERNVDNGDFSVIATVAGNDTLYTDTTIEEGYSYSYKVNAYINSFYSSYSNPVDVSTIPNIIQAEFSASPLSGYLPLVVAFTDLSTGNYDSWSWNFGNGETSNESDPTVTYSEVGLYTVSLTISAGAESSSETKTDYIEVEEFTGVFQDGFEDYDDFVLEFAPWMQYDVDGGDTWSIEGYTFQNENYIGSYIIFNPNQVDPPLEDCDPHSGNKMAACFDAVTASAPNDDWLIAPQVIIADGDEVSFFAKSYSDMYGLERFNVAVSITGTAPADFTVISAAPYIQAPTVWTEYNYDLSTYAGQSIYVAIQCVSNDAFFFLVDDFVVAPASNRDISKTELSSNVNGSVKKCKK